MKNLKTLKNWSVNTLGALIIGSMVAVYVFYHAHTADIETAVSVGFGITLFMQTYWSGTILDKIKELTE